MKKISILLFTLLMTIGNVCADNILSVSDVVIPSGSRAAIEINCDFENKFKGYQLDIEIVDGLSLELNEAGTPICENGFSTDHTVSGNKISENKYRFAALSFTGQLLGQSGTVLRVYVQAKEDVAIGSSFAGKIAAIEFTTENNTASLFDNISFSLTVGEPTDTRVVLDENSSVMPVDATGVDVRVKRTIKANTWSSLVLPFNMSNEQMKATFGEDVKVAEFTGWETTSYDANDNANAILVTFSEVSAISANIPYIIKVSSEISEFVVDGVTIQVDKEPCVTVGKKADQTLGYFSGSYVPMTIDEECLFLSDNKFWYSTGLTQMKGYRGYFHFWDILGSYSDNNSAPIKMCVISENGSVTNINTIDADIQSENSSYTLEGIKAPMSFKGIVIKNGKKYINK